MTQKQQCAWEVPSRWDPASVTWRASGLTKPDDSDAKIKFLVAETLCLVGGLVSNICRNRLPMNLKAKLCDWRNVVEQTFVPSRSGELLMKLPGIANVTLDAES